MRNLNCLRVGLAALALVIAGLLAQQGDVVAASLRSQVQVYVKADLSDTTGLSTTTSPLFVQRVFDLTNGTGLNQADKVWSARRSVASAAVDTLDLAGGGLIDAFGGAFNPARIKIIMIAAAATNTTNLTIQNVANGVPILGATGTGCTVGPFGSATIRPGTIFVLADPSATAFVVTAGTGDLITVTNGTGATASYDIAILGASI